MKKSIIVLLLVAIFLIGCEKKTIKVSFNIEGFDVKSIDDIDVIVGDEILLPEIDEDWLEFQGWYLDPDYEIKAEGLVAGEDSIMLYGYYQLALSIAVIGDETLYDYDVILSAVAAYATHNNRIFKTYNKSYTENSQEKTFDSIEEAINDGAKIIFLTSSYLQSEAVYDAQTLYPNITFVFLGEVPKEHYFYGPSHIAENTLVTRAPSEHSAFLAGYAAVIDGKRSLGFFGEDGERSFSSGIAFIAGAYYAANELDVTITINDDAYKILSSEATYLLFRRYYLSAYNSGTELIYTDRLIDEKEFEGVADQTDKYLILGDGKSTPTSEVVLGSIMWNHFRTITHILNDYFNREFTGGMTMPLACEMDFNSSNFTNFTEEDQNTIMTKLEQDIITLPHDYDTLMAFLATLESADGVMFDKELIEGIQPY